MSLITVLKNKIGSNNKRGWVDPEPTIRIAETKSGKPVYGHEVAIKDEAGNIVAKVISSTDGKPVVKCGAKVAILTAFPAEVIR